MNEPKFEVGDRVKVIDSYKYRDIIGKTGTIKLVDKLFGTSVDKLFDKYIYGIEFDEYINGHDLFGRGRSGHCKWCAGDFLEQAYNYKTIITTDGKTTTAKMYDGKKLVNSAKAVCSPEDEFDFNIGASIALERLTGQIETIPEEEHFYNGKVVCVKNKDLESYFTVGKIYDIVDGLLKADVKDRQLDNICSIDYLNSIFSGNRLEFLEIVE